MTAAVTAQRASTPLHAAPGRSYCASCCRRRLVLVGAVILGIVAAARDFCAVDHALRPDEALKILDRLQSPRDRALVRHRRTRSGRVLAGDFRGALLADDWRGMVVLISMTGGVLLGLTAGFFRRLDGPIMRLVDAMMSFPDILLAIALVAVLGASMTNVILALAIVYTPRVARVVRASTLVVRELLFIEAARALGVSNVAHPVYPYPEQHRLANPGAGDVHLCLRRARRGGVVVPWRRRATGAADVGNDDRKQPAIRASGDLARGIFPGVAIILSALSLQMVGDGFRDLLDPKLRKAI